MSNPYTAPTLTNYNQVPPGDDGEDTASNYVKWSTHKNYIGDPLKNYLDDLATNISTAFGTLPFNTYEDKTDNYTVTTSDQGKLLVMTVTAKTFTLPAAATAGANFMVAFLNGDVPTVTIDGATSETIDGNTTVTLGRDDWAILVCDGSAWRSLRPSGYPEAKRRIYTNTTQYSASDTTLVKVFNNIHIKDSTYYRITQMLGADGGGGFGMVMDSGGQGATGPTRVGWQSWANESGAVVFDAGQTAESMTADLSASYGALSAYRQVMEGIIGTGSDSDVWYLGFYCRGATTVNTVVDPYEAVLIIEELV